MHFRIIGSIENIETIASGRGIRERLRRRKAYGHLGWRKRKGIATIELSDAARRALHLAG
jgi:hypothetical protein